MQIVEQTSAQIEFIRASMSLSGLKYDEEDEERERNKILAKILFSTSNFVHPYLINGGMLGHQKKGLRRGTEWKLKGIVPEADEIEDLLDIWVRDVEKGLKDNVESSFKVREDFCWRMHDEFRCIHAFKEGNGGTARFVLNHLRTLFGLPILVLNELNAGEYHRRLDEYSEKVFIPNMRKKHLR